MWRSEIYAVEPCRPLRRSGALPIHVEPRDGEALYSWIVRLGHRLALCPPDAARCAFGINGTRRPDWWRRPEPGELATIANRTGLAIERVRAMTLTGWAQARSDERHERFEALGFRRQRAGQIPSRPTPMCRMCLAEDTVPFVRLEWMIGWIAICPKHRTILATHCPACGARLSLPGVSMRAKVTIDRCRRCNVRIGGSNDAPALDGICAIQARLLDLKREGAGNFQGVGQMTWPAMTGLVDVLLTALWLPRARHARERLFAQILIDCGLDPEERLRMEWPSNYGAMLVLAWLFDGWPHRMTQAMDLLRAPGLAELAMLAARMGDDLSQEFMVMLAGLVPDRPPAEQEWRQWLENLPCTAEMLRARSKREFRHDVSEKLRWLANLRQGIGLATVAERARLKPRTIERWLETGMDYGLDAILAEQTRISFLTPDERRAIADWLDTVTRFGKGPGAWTVEHAQHEIAVRFGVLISTAGVRSLYRHGRRRR